MTVLVQHGARLWVECQNAINWFSVHCWFFVCWLVHFVWLLVFLLCTIRHPVLQGGNCCHWQRSRLQGTGWQNSVWELQARIKHPKLGDMMGSRWYLQDSGDDLNFGTAAMRCFHSETSIWVFRQLQFLCRGLCYLSETCGWPEECLKKLRCASRPQAARALQHNKAVTRWKKSSSL